MATIDLACPKCGKKRFEGPARPKKNDYVTCLGCRKRFTVEEIGQAAALKLATKALGKRGRPLH